MAAATAVHHEQPSSRSRRSRLAAIVCLVLWGLITHGTSAGTGDEPHYEMITHSLAFDRDLDLTTDYSNPDNLAMFGRFEGGAHVQPGKDGRLRPVHDIGMPVLFVPYYTVAYWVTGKLMAHVPARWLERARLNFNVMLRHFLSLAMIAVTAAIGVGLLDIFTLLSATSRRAFAWTLLMVLSPPILSHSFLFFTEIVSACIAFYVFVWLRGLPTSRFQALLAGAATGYLLLVHARNAGLIAGLIILAVLRARRWGDRGLIVAFLSGAAALFAVRTGVNYHMWGTWLTNPHERFAAVEGWQPFVAEGVTRITGWLFDQEHGLLPYAPIYLLAPAGWLALWKRDRQLCAEISLLVGAYVAVMTMPNLNVHGWRGGWTPAARFLVPVAPFLAILTFAAVAHLRRLPAIVIGIVGLQVGIDALVWNDPHLLWNDGIGTSALLKYLDGGTGRLSLYAPSLLPPVGDQTIAVIAGIAVGWLVLTTWLDRRSIRTGS